MLPLLIVLGKNGGRIAGCLLSQSFPATPSSTEELESGRRRKISGEAAKTRQTNRRWTRIYADKRRSVRCAWRTSWPSENLSVLRFTFAPLRLCV